MRVEIGTYDMQGIDISGEVAVTGGRVLSDEQRAIIDRPPDKTIVVNAAAGSGKTTTLVDYANRWKSHRGLYLAFNKDIAKEAQHRFPPWVRAQTVNSYAYQALGVSRYADRLTGRINRQTIRMAVGDLHNEYLTPDRTIRCIQQALTNFCNDGGTELKVEHCGLEKSPPATQAAMLPRIAAIVKKFLDYENSGLPFTHDMYLKRLEMSGSLGSVHDYIMIDEAQDSNGVTLSLVQKSGKPVIFIGDSKQSIYAFRGAINAMQTVEGERYPLSMSWRFGQKLADLCNYVLSFSDEPQLAPIRGRPDRETKIESYQGRAPARSFILSRTNARLFEGLIAIPPQTRFFVAGGFDTLARQLLSAYHLSRNEQRSVTDPYVRGFSYWEDMLEESVEGDPDAKKLVKIVKDYGDQIPGIIERLRAFQRPHHQDAQILLSTAHKAKGLEADSVIVLDDFPTLKELQARLLDNKLSQVDYEQEINLLYVAVSRAKHRLLLAPALYDEVAHVIGETE
jgi:hypothetical protein